MTGTVVAADFACSAAGSPLLNLAGENASVVFTKQ
jgi:hypothetical protein